MELEVKNLGTDGYNLPSIYELILPALLIAYFSENEE